MNGRNELRPYKESPDGHHKLRFHVPSGGRNEMRPYKTGGARSARCTTKGPDGAPGSEKMLKCCFSVTMGFVSKTGVGRQLR